MPYSKEQIAKGFKNASVGDDAGWDSDPMVKAVKGLLGGNTAAGGDDDIQKKAIQNRIKKLQSEED